MKVIQFDSPMGQFHIPLKLVAEDRAKHYERIGTPMYQEEVDFVMNDDFEGIDWILNNTNWEDWKHAATKISNTQTDVDDFWCDADNFEITEIAIYDNKMNKPDPKDYGWQDQNGFDDEPGGWMLPGGQEMYEHALNRYESPALQILLDELRENSHPQNVEEVIFWALKHYAARNIGSMAEHIAYAICRRIEDAEADADAQK